MTWGETATTQRAKAQLFSLILIQYDRSFSVLFEYEFSSLQLPYDYVAALSINLNSAVVEDCVLARVSVEPLSQITGVVLEEIHCVVEGIVSYEAPNVLFAVHPMSD